MNKMRTKKIYDLQTREQSGVSIYGDHSISSVDISLDLLNAEFGGDMERAFHTVKNQVL